MGSCGTPTQPIGGGGETWSLSPPPSLSLQSSKCTVGLYFGVIIFRTMLLVIQSFVLPILCGQLEIEVELLR